MSTPTPPVTLTAAQLADRLDAGATSVLDVRTPGECGAAAIPGSHHLPLDQLDAHLDELAGNLTGALTLVCRTGQRPTQAYCKLAAAGAGELTVLDGGLRAWQAAGEPVRTGSGRWEPERQVRLVAGTVMLAGVLASYRWPRARLLSGAVGGGLTYAAVSNTCAMSTVLLKLPYNKLGHRDAQRAVAALGRPSS